MPNNELDELQRAVADDLLYNIDSTRFVYKEVDGAVHADEYDESGNVVATYRVAVTLTAV